MCAASALSLRHNNNAIKFSDDSPPSNLLTAPAATLKADVLLASSIPDMKDNSPCIRVLQVRCHCASKQTRLDATRRRVCIRVATGLNRRVRDVPMAALLHASVRVAVKNLLLLPRVVGSVWLQQRHVQRTCR